MSEYSGNENLEVLSQTPRFNDWMYEQLSPGIKGDVLEVGSGIGTFSEKVIKSLPGSCHISLTDISSNYVKLLEEKFASSHENISVHKLNLNSITDFENIGYERFDSILAINVLEHIEDDILALTYLYRMLKKRGILVLLVPCHEFLYNVIDQHIGHFRRYTKKSLEDKIDSTRFSIEQMFYFNMLGIIGWYINGNLIKIPKINSNAAKIFDRLVPILRPTEKIIGRKIGLSLICYLTKK